MIRAGVSARDACPAECGLVTRAKSCAFARNENDFVVKTVAARAEPTAEELIARSEELQL